MCLSNCTLIHAPGFIYAIFHKTDTSPSLPSSPHLSLSTMQNQWFHQGGFSFTHELNENQKKKSTPKNQNTTCMLMRHTYSLANSVIHGLGRCWVPLWMSRTRMNLKPVPEDQAHPVTPDTEAEMQDSPQEASLC